MPACSCSPTAHFIVRPFNTTRCFFTADSGDRIGLSATIELGVQSSSTVPPGV